MAKVLLQKHAAGPGGSQPLQGDIGRNGVIARAHRRVAEHPVADGKPGRIRTDRADPADAARARHDRQVERIIARAVEDLVHVGQHARGDDVDDHLAGADGWVRNVLDYQRRSKGFEHGSFHDVHLKVG